MMTIRDVPLLQFFFNIIQKPLIPRPLPFERLVDFFDELGDTLHCTKIGQYKA